MVVVIFIQRKMIDEIAKTEINYWQDTIAPISVVFIDFVLLCKASS